MNTTNAVTASTIANTIRTRRIGSSPVCAMPSVETTACGNPATMPAKISSEIPLPTPRSVICSPSHIRNSVPAVRPTTVVNTKLGPGA